MAVCKICKRHFKLGRKKLILCDYCRYKYDRLKQLFTIKLLPNLGTTDFLSFACRDCTGRIDFFKEYLEIQKERKKLGLKKRKL